VAKAAAPRPTGGTDTALDLLAPIIEANAEAAEAAEAAEPSPKRATPSLGPLLWTLAVIAILVLVACIVTGILMVSGAISADDAVTGAGIIPGHLATWLTA
jgi:hypothetical protein